MFSKQTMMYVLQLAIFITIGLILFKNHLDTQELLGEVNNLKGVVRLLTTTNEKDDDEELTHDIDDVFNRYSFTLNHDDNELSSIQELSEDEPEVETPETVEPETEQKTTEETVRRRIVQK